MLCVLFGSSHPVTVHLLKRSVQGVLICLIWQEEDRLFVSRSLLSTITLFLLPVLPQACHQFTAFQRVSQK